MKKAARIIANSSRISEDEELPWDIIDNGVSKKYLLAERHKAYRGETTPNCLNKCNGCGANRLERCRI